MTSTNLIGCASHTYTPLLPSIDEETDFLSSGFNTSEFNYAEMLCNTQNVPQQDDVRLTSNPSCMYGSCERLDWRRNGLGQENKYPQVFPCQSYENLNPIFDPFYGDVFPQYYDYGKLVNEFKLL